MRILPGTAHLSVSCSWSNGGSPCFAFLRAIRTFERRNWRGHRPSTFPWCTRPSLRMARSSTQASRVDLGSCLLRPQHPGVHCLAARHSLGSSAHRVTGVTRRRPFSLAASGPSLARPDKSVRAHRPCLRGDFPRLASRVPCCRSSAGEPVRGAVPPLVPVRDCSR